MKLHSTTNNKIPLFLESVKAGFPSPAADFIEKKLDLNNLLIKHPEATFFVRASGDSMKDAHIVTDDILVIDRSQEPSNEKIVLAVINGEFTVKKFRKIGSQIFLIPENKSYPTIKITEDMEFQIWGIVTSVIRQV